MGAIDIFGEIANVFVRYQVAIKIEDKVMAGTPADPKLIEGWIRKNTGLEKQSEELRRAVLRTAVELGYPVSEGMTLAELYKASEEVAAIKQAVVFKRHDERPYIEARCVKAMLKECTNIAFAGTGKWGKTDKYQGKGPRNFVAEKVFVRPDKIMLGAETPEFPYLFVGHPVGAQGPMSTLTYFEYVTSPVLRFEVLVLKDAVEYDNWAGIWATAERNGLGSLRSQGFGQFDLLEFKKMGEAALTPVESRVA